VPVGWGGGLFRSHGKKKGYRRPSEWLSASEGVERNSVEIQRQPKKNVETSWSYNFFDLGVLRCSAATGRKEQQ